MQILTLIVEKADEGYFGRVKYEDNLIVVDADDVASLEKKAIKLLKKYHQLNPKDIEFKHEYDLSALFEVFSFLNVSEVAKLSEMNVSLLRQYRNGLKFPSEKQAKRIEETIRSIGRQLMDVHIISE